MVVDKFLRLLPINRNQFFSTRVVTCLNMAAYTGTNLINHGPLFPASAHTPTPSYLDFAVILSD